MRSISECISMAVAFLGAERRGNVWVYELEDGEERECKLDDLARLGVLLADGQAEALKAWLANQGK